MEQWTVGEIGNKRVRGHGLHGSAPQSAIRVFDPHMALEQAPELERSVVDIPDPIVDLLQAHVLTNADGRDVHPAAAPPDTANPAYGMHIEAMWIFHLGQGRGLLPSPGGVAR